MTRCELLDHLKKVLIFCLKVHFDFDARVQLLFDVLVMYGFKRKVGASFKCRHEKKNLLKTFTSID